MAKKSTVTRTNPNKLASIRRIALEFGKYRVRAGWAVDMGAAPETVMIATINALGAPSANIPPRPVVEGFVRSNAALIRRKHRSAVVAANRGKDPRPKLDELAELLRAGGKQAVYALDSPSNAPSTIDQKGFDNPLVGAGADGGRLVAEFNAEVSER